VILISDIIQTLSRFYAVRVFLLGMLTLYHNVSRNTSFSGTIIKYNLTRRYLTKVRKPDTHHHPPHPKLKKGVPGSYTLGSAQTIFIFKKQDRNAAISIPPTPIYFVAQSYPTLSVQKPPGMLSKTKHPTPIFFLL
jgi:hypothetical protein